ncbi:SDR family NAD(P)-dependent oxidoreductase [Leisingera sp. S132]|uniref:SDR family NAD(P)-dependent oxidoreductase n=1 Tax=Leisingera sp. S132 TaxID=2867016 RepID=UPI0028834010|nr:SDR family NAD(P)-dependent oxidoreductase [Leisingera sp. S132]
MPRHALPACRLALAEHRTIQSHQLTIDRGVATTPETACIISESSGSGLETTRQSAKSGHQVTLLGPSEAKLEAAQAEFGPLANVWKVDLMDLTNVQMLVQELKTDSRYFSKLVNAAGVFASNLFRNMAPTVLTDTWA